MSRDLVQLHHDLNGSTTPNHLTLTSSIVDTVAELLLVVVEGREEFPIMVDIDPEQITCTTHLWSEAEVKEGALTALMEAMLLANLPLPLSSFGKIGTDFQLFGALAADSSSEAIRHEIGVLSDNTLRAFEALGCYLKGSYED